MKKDKIDYKREIIAGITTFLSMGYIIIVNPLILSNAGMPIGALVTSTCITAGLATIMMGVVTNTPLALASGMGTNAFFAFSLVKGMNIPWEVALAAVFIEGIIFIILSLSKIRENIINAISMNLKYSISVGIGFFIAFIGLVNSNIIVKNEATLIGIGNFMDLQVLITLLGFVLICVFVKEAIPSFLILLLIPLTYNISSGIGIGITFYVIMSLLYNFFRKEYVSVSPIIIVLSCVFVLKLLLSS